MIKRIERAQELKGAGMKVLMGGKATLVATFFLGTFGRRGDAVLSRIDPCSRGLRVRLLPHQLMLMFHKARQGDTLFKPDYCKDMLLLHERGAFRIDMQWGSCAGSSAEYEYSQSIRCGSTDHPVRLSGKIPPSSALGKRFFDCGQILSLGLCASCTDYGFPACEW